MSILAVSNLYKTFQETIAQRTIVQRTIALRDVSFSMDEQETLSIIGPSGSGKSTLLRMIMNLDQPDAGTIRLFDTVVDWKKNHELLYQKVGFIFQEFNLFDHLSVEANIQLAMRLVQKKTGKKNNKQRPLNY
jgi:polar amino acid transport system ATP-binding protein